MLRFGGSKAGNPIRKVKVTVWTPNQFTRFHSARQTYVRHCSCFAIKMLQIQPDIKGKLLNCQHYYLKLSRFHQDHVRFDFYEFEIILRTFFVKLFSEMQNHSKSNYSSLCSNNSIDLIILVISINSSRLRST